MPTLNYATHWNVPVNVEGTITNMDLYFKDQGARDLIAGLGNALQWMGVTTTELVDNVTTDPDISVGGQTKTATAGGMAQYNGEEFVYDGAKWQAIGKNNFGDLAFANSVVGTTTPAGSVEITQGTDTTESVTPFGSAGTLPYFTYDSTNEVATFNPGVLASAGTAVSVLTARGTDTAAFTGTQATITSTPPVEP